MLQICFILYKNNEIILNQDNSILMSYVDSYLFYCTTEEVLEYLVYNTKKTAYIYDQQKMLK